MSQKGSKDLVKKGFAQGEREECVLEGGAYKTEFIHGSVKFLFPELREPCPFPW